MAKAIMDLINRSSRDPKTIRIDHKVLTVPTVEQAYYEIRGRSKTEALTRLIDLHDLKLGIIFCNTKRMVDDLTDELVARGYSADRIHGDMSQAQRELVMTKFRNSGLEFLVATDVAARGIDVENIEVVFNHDLPWDEEDYVHRNWTNRTRRQIRASVLISGRTRDLQVAEHRTVHKDENCPAPGTFCRRSRGETWEPLFRENPCGTSKRRFRKRIARGRPTARTGVFVN